MKLLRRMLIVGLLVIFSFQVFAQDSLIVDPGLGTLNSAISENGGDKIYVLQAGKWYGLDGTIEIAGYPLQIVGQETDDMPAILQNGTTQTGGLFTTMFSALGDLTLKNIFVVNQSSSGQVAPVQSQIVACGSNINLTVDNCIFDPVGQGTFAQCPHDSTDIFLTNNQFFRQGHQVTNNDASFINTYFGSGLDTVWIENNTFVSTGIGVFQSRTNQSIDKFVWMNHNTFIHHKSQLDWTSNHVKGYYCTNNIFFDFMTFPYLKQYRQWDPDGLTPRNHYRSLVEVDTLTQHLRDSLGISESERKAFVEYNLQYTSQEFYDLVQWAEDNDFAESYIMPLLWLESTPDQMTFKPLESYLDSCRTARMFNDEGTYANFKDGNMMWDIDPEWNESKIYELSDSLAEWTKPVLHEVGYGGPATDPDKLTKWFWNIDGWNDVDPAYYPVEWPRFDGSYNNAQIKSASIAGLPLGDLNWFPDKKAKWEQHREEIEEHITSLNETQMDLTAIDNNTNSPEIFNLSQNYPNPFNPTTNIDYTISKPTKVKLTVYNVLGQKVKELVNKKQNTGKYSVQWNGTDMQGHKVAGGVYFYKLEAKGFEKTKKLLLLK